MDSSAGHHAFKFDGQAITDLGTLPNLIRSDASAVSALNHPVGSSAHPLHTAPQAVLWQNSRIIDLSDFLPPTYVSSVAVDINDVGQIVGLASLGQPNQYRAFIWENSEATILPLPPGTDFSNAVAINAYSEIAVGAAAPYPENPALNQRFGFIYSDGRWTSIPAFGKQDDLPGFDFISNTPADINDAGVVVGICQTSFNYPLPYVWQNQTLRRLDLMVVQPNNMLVSVDPRRATAINNLGQITCNAYAFYSDHLEEVVALLTPIPAFPGDTNCDSQVNIDDLTDVILNWNNVGGAADLNFDQSVDVLDLAQVVENWSAAK